MGDLRLGSGLGCDRPISLAAGPSAPFHDHKVQPISNIVNLLTAFDNDCKQSGKCQDRRAKRTVRHGGKCQSPYKTAIERGTANPSYGIYALGVVWVESYRYNALKRRA